MIAEGSQVPVGIIGIKGNPFPAEALSSWMVAQERSGLSPSV